MNQHRRIGLTDAASFLLAIYYLWYQLPFMRATFQAERYKYLFFACFAAGILLLCAARLENCRMRVRLTLRVSVLTPVLLYMAVMAVCYLLHAGDAARHIRVSFSFWGTLLVYRLFSFDRRAQVRFGRYLLFLFLLTALTSAAAVLTDSSAARAISNASQRPEAVARDYVLMRRNVSGIYLFQDFCPDIGADAAPTQKAPDERADSGLRLSGGDQGVVYHSPVRAAGSVHFNGCIPAAGRWPDASGRGWLFPAGLSAG